MKKLTLALSALAAVFGAASAKAEVSVSGSGSVGYTAPAGTDADGFVTVGQFVSFGLSTTTASGMTISGGMGLSNTPTVNNGQAVSGGKTLTFASGGASLTIGDVEAADTPGSVGGLVGDEIDDEGGFDSDVATGFADDDGLGFKFSTAVGASSLTLTYVGNDDFDNSGALQSDAAGDNSVVSVGVSVPMGAYTVNVGMASVDGTTESSAGASVSAALGGGTLTVGYSQQTLDESEKDTAAVYSFASATATVRSQETAAGEGDLSADGDTTVYGATYSMALDADTAFAVGYQSAKDADNDSTTQFDATLSRALGGGASVFLEMRSLSGDAATDGTAVALGSRVSF